MSDFFNNDLKMIDEQIDKSDLRSIDLKMIDLIIYLKNKDKKIDHLDLFIRSISDQFINDQYRFDYNFNQYKISKVSTYKLDDIEIDIDLDNFRSMIKILNDKDDFIFINIINDLIKFINNDFDDDLNIDQISFRFDLFYDLLSDKFDDIDQIYHLIRLYIIDIADKFKFDDYADIDLYDDISIYLRSI